MTTKLYVGPVSREVLEACFKTKRDVRVCASVGQIGPGAYTGMTYGVFMECVRIYQEKYDKRNLFVERDHYGRDQPNDDWLADTMNLRSEKNYFHGMHLHSFNLVSGLDAVSFDKSFEWQIGPGEDMSKPVTYPKEPIRDYKGWVSAYVGPKIVGTRNDNELMFRAIEQLRRYFPNALIRCHACDYLPKRTLKAVKALVDGINIAPQLGVLQSLWYLSAAKHDALDIKDWQQACMSDGKQLNRWNLHIEEWYGVGHYHFDKIAWRSEMTDKVVNCHVNFIEEIDTL